MKRTIRLDTIKAINDFCQIINRYPFSAEIESDRYIINAKSIMGIYSLNLSKPVTLVINSDDDCVENFLNEISDYFE